MYTVYVEATEFKGQRTIKQHRMVNEVCCYFTHFSFSLYQALQFSVFIHTDTKVLKRKK